MTLIYDASRHNERGLVSALAGSNEKQKEERERLISAIRTYAPQDVTDGVSDEDLLRDPQIIELTNQSLKAARDYDFSHNLDEVIGSVPGESLENLARTLPKNEIEGDNADVHNNAYAAHRRYEEALTRAQILKRGGEEAERMVNEYAEQQANEVREQEEAKLAEDSYEHLSDELKTAWVERVSALAEAVNSDPKRLRAKYEEKMREADEEYKGSFGDTYREADFAANNLRVEIGKGGNEAEAAKNYVDLMRFDGVSTPEQLQKALGG